MTKPPFKASQGKKWSHIPCFARDGRHALEAWLSTRGRLGGVGTIDSCPRLGGLKRLANVGLTIGAAIHLALAAKIEVARQRIAKRPAAIVCEKRLDSLPLGNGDRCGVIGARRGRSCRIFTHKIILAQKCTLGLRRMSTNANKWGIGQNPIFARPLSKNGRSRPQRERLRRFFNCIQSLPRQIDGDGTRLG